MKIAFFTNNYLPFVGGVPIAIENLAHRLRARRHRVFIFAPEYEEPCDDDPDVFRIWSWTKFNATSFSLPLLMTLEPQSHFADLEPDLVHVHHPFLLGATGLNLGRAMRLPVVFTYHTMYEKYAHYLPFDEKMVGEVAVQVAWQFANCCDAVIAPSTDIRNILLERGVRVPVRVIPTGVDLMRFRGGDRRWLRRRCGIPEGAPVMLFLSRLAREKNVGFLLEMFALVAAEHPDVHLVMVGSGEEEETLRRQADDAGFGGRVHMPGTLTGRDLISAYRGGTVFVFASTTETQGMVVLEAMAARLPVVAVDAPGVRDVVVNGENGYLVPEGNTRAFADKVLEVLDNPSVHERLTRGSADRARELSLARTTRKVEELYRFVLRNPPQGREQPLLMLREILSYHWHRLREGLDDFLP